MHTTPKNPSPINRLKFLNASTLLKWLQAEQAASRGESARQIAERASRELGFTVTIHNVQRMRWIIAHEITKPHP
jgi:hypothetical protein